MTEKSEMVALADKLHAKYEKRELPSWADIYDAAAALRSAARTDAGYGAGFEACREALQSLSECRDFVSDVAGGALFTNRAIENAKEIRSSALASVETLEAAIAALPAPGGNATGWQPIETAPKGKGLIDVWTVGWGAEPHRVADCYYDSICDEWRTSRPTGQIICVKARYVTHWQPLPPAPTITRKSQSEERS